jgi:hypothetical protein
MKPYVSALFAAAICCIESTAMEPKPLFVIPEDTECDSETTPHPVSAGILRKSGSPASGRRVKFDSVDESSMETEYPKTPFIKHFPRYRVDEPVEPLAVFEDAVDDIHLLAQFGCGMYSEIRAELYKRRDALIQGAKKQLRATGEAAALYSIKKIFGYELTEEDKSKLSEILENPRWISLAIDTLHRACASAISTSAQPTGTETSTEEAH